MRQSVPTTEEMPDTAKADRYCYGTPGYTKAELFVLFTWILGNFAFSLIGDLWRNILPFGLKSEGVQYCDSTRNHNDSVGNHPFPQSDHMHS